MSLIFGAVHAARVRDNARTATATGLRALASQPCRNHIREVREAEVTINGSLGWICISIVLRHSVSPGSTRAGKKSGALWLWRAGLIAQHSTGCRARESKYCKQLCRPLREFGVKGREERRREVEEEGGRSAKIHRRD